MLCECGCGKDSGVYPRTHGINKKGAPKRFLVGHGGGSIEHARKFQHPREPKAFCKNGHPRTPDNLYGNYGCKVCNKTRTKKWREANPEENWKKGAQQNKKRQYGMSQEQFEDLLKKQQYKCPICMEKFDYSNARDFLKNPKAPCVDHVHDGTKNFRGLLCRTCNQGLGMFKDNPVTLANAIAYLRDTSAQAKRVAEISKAVSYLHDCQDALPGVNHPDSMGASLGELDWVAEISRLIHNEGDSECQKLKNTRLESKAPLAATA